MRLSTIPLYRVEVTQRVAQQHSYPPPHPTTTPAHSDPGSQARTAVPRRVQPKSRAKPVVSHGTGGLPRTSQNNVILLHKRHTRTHTGLGSSAARLVPATAFVSMLCVSVCGPAARGIAKFSLGPCGMRREKRSPVLERWVKHLKGK